MRRYALPCLLLACLALLAQPAYAAEWPDTWLGLPDNGYTRLRIAVFFYGAVLHDIPDAEGTPALPGDAGDWLSKLAAMPEIEESCQLTEFERMRSELEEDRRFYWRNSRYNLVLDHEWFADYTPRLLSSIAASDPPYNSPVDMPAYAQARQDYDGILQIYVLYHHDTKTEALVRVRGGGGFTWGCDIQKRLCGFSWWAAPPADHACGSDWLECHEFGHQLDSLLHASGHPEHWFNHLALSEGNTARFMEHFDCMAYILRRTKEQDWLDLAWGERHFYEDADRDGMPDADDSLTLLGLEVDPDPSLPDADGDGLTDRAELLALNGNRHGHGERLHSALAQQSAQSADSDSDGLPDGADEYPWLPLAGNVMQDGAAAAWLEAPDDALPPYADSRPATLRLPAAADAPALAADVSYAPDKALHLRLYWGTPGDVRDVELRLALDLDHDGWFAGDDGYRLTIADGKVSATHMVASSHSEWPQELPMDLAALPVPMAHIPPLPGYAYGVELGLHRDLFPELAAKAGELVGFNLGARYGGTPWYFMVAEPNTLMPLELR